MLFKNLALVFLYLFWFLLEKVLASLLYIYDRSGAIVFALEKVENQYFPTIVGKLIASALFDKVECILIFYRAPAPENVWLL